MNDPNGKINVAEKLLAVRLNCSFAFGRVTDKRITHETQSAKQTTALVVRKELLPGAAGVRLRTLQATLNAFYTYHKKMTLSSVNEGERLLPVLFYMDYMQEYGTYRQLVDESFDAFRSGYPSDVQQAERLLQTAYNPSDYPDATELHNTLRFKVTTLPLPSAPEKLLDAVGASLEEDVKGYLHEAVQQGINDINERFKVLLKRMVERLSKPDGVVRDSLTENLAELVGLIPSFNVTEDDSLTLLAAEVKDKLLCVGPTTLRGDEAKRRETADAAAEILRRMG